MLRSVPPWSFGKSVLVMLQFLYGAAYTRVELLALDAAGMPVRLYSLEAPVISRVPRQNGFVLETFDPTGGHAPASCFGWNPSAGRLVRAAC